MKGTFARPGSPLCFRCRKIRIRIDQLIGDELVVRSEGCDHVESHRLRVRVRVEQPGWVRLSLVDCLEPSLKHPYVFQAEIDRNLRH